MKITINKANIYASQMEAAKKVIAIAAAMFFEEEDTIEYAAKIAANAAFGPCTEVIKIESAEVLRDAGTPNDYFFDGSEHLDVYVTIWAANYSRCGKIGFCLSTALNTPFDGQREYAQENFFLVKYNRA